MGVILGWLSYLIIVNIIGFALFGVDKHKAGRHAWRIKESTLFLAAFIGGSIGCILGMQVFRHKTKHMKFMIGMSVILILQIGMVFLAHMKGLI